MAIHKALISDTPFDCRASLAMTNALISASLTAARPLKTDRAGIQEFHGDDDVERETGSRTSCSPRMIGHSPDQRRNVRTPDRPTRLPSK